MSLLARPLLGWVLGISCTLTICHGAAAQTLKAVQERGIVTCGVSRGVIGFSFQSDDGEWAGIDADFCRALAAAIFNDSTKVKFVPLSADDRFHALQAKEVDLLSRNSSWTMSREAELGIVFTGVTFYDGQGFMVSRARNVSSALELSGSKVCVQKGTTTELNLQDYFRANGMTYNVISTITADDALKAYDSGRCDVLTADASALHGERLKTTTPNNHDILPEIISKEPLGPAVRQDDFQWFNVVKWVHFAMLNAEELGIGAQTIDDALKSRKPDVRRLVGTEGDLATHLGLANDWAVRVVRLVGNYAEVYERNVGIKSKLAIPRGINQLWTQGGLLYGPPVR